MSPRIAIEFLLLAALWGSSFLFMRLGAAEFGAHQHLRAPPFGWAESVAQGEQAVGEHG